MKTPILFSLSVSFLLSACTVGPDYVRPTLPTAAGYPEALVGGVDLTTQWWQGFGDNQLDTFVGQALAANVDLKLAAARVEEATAGLADVAGAQLPAVDATGGVTKSKISDRGFIPIDATNGRSRLIYRTGLVTAFELDFWGKLRRATEAAQAQLLATQEGRVQVELAVVTSVVRTYALLRASEVQQRSAEEISATRLEESRLVAERSKLGAANASEQALAEVNLAVAISAQADARRAHAAAEHLLGFLVGQPDLVVAPRSGAALSVPPVPAVGLPAALLRYRPDVSAAEQSLVSANARIGFVRAAALPTFALTAALGNESRDFSRLWTSPSGTTSLGLDVRAPLFDFGRNAAREAGAVALQHQAAANYEKTLLTAFREVRDALVDIRETMAADAAAVRREQAAREAFRVAEARRTLGQLPLLDYLLARRQLAESLAAVAKVRAERLGAQVDLIKALGGARVDQVAAPR